MTFVTIILFILINFNCVQMTPQKSISKLLEVSRVILIPKDKPSLRLECPVSSLRLNSDKRGSREVMETYHDYNHEKYVNIVKTGELQINNISASDEGVYRCIVELIFTLTNGSTTRFYDTAAVELVTESDGEKKHELFTGDITRAMVTAIVVLLLLTLSCIVYNNRWKESTSEKLNERSSCIVDGESLKNWDTTGEQSKTSSDKDNVTYNVSDSDSLDESTVKINDKASLQAMCKSNKEIFIISSKKSEYQHEKPLLFSPTGTTTEEHTKCGGGATLGPPSATSLPVDSALERELMEEKQDGISLFKRSTPSKNLNAPRVPPSSSRSGPVPLLLFETSTFSSVSGSSGSGGQAPGLVAGDSSQKFAPMNTPRIPSKGSLESGTDSDSIFTTFQLQSSL